MQVEPSKSEEVTLPAPGAPTNHYICSSLYLTNRARTAQVHKQSTTYTTRPGSSNLVHTHWSWSKKALDHISQYEITTISRNPTTNMFLLIVENFGYPKVLNSHENLVQNAYKYVQILKITFRLVWSPNECHSWIPGKKWVLDIYNMSYVEHI